MLILSFLLIGVDSPSLSLIWTIKILFFDVLFFFFFFLISNKRCFINQSRWSTLYNFMTDGNFSTFKLLHKDTLTKPLINSETITDFHNHTLVFILSLMLLQFDTICFRKCIHFAPFILFRQHTTKWYWQTHFHSSIQTKHLILIFVRGFCVFFFFWFILRSRRNDNVWFIFPELESLILSWVESGASTNVSVNRDRGGDFIENNKMISCWWLIKLYY